MFKKPAISRCLQDIASHGIKQEIRGSQYYGDWFHLLLFLAWQGWNISVTGKEEVFHNLEQEFEKARRNLGVSKKDIKKHFVSTDLIRLVRLFSEIKTQNYPFDSRFVHAIETTPEGALRVYSAQHKSS